MESKRVTLAGYNARKNGRSLPSDRHKDSYFHPGREDNLTYDEFVEEFEERFPKHPELKLLYNRYCDDDDLHKSIADYFRSGKTSNTHAKKVISDAQQDGRQTIIINKGYTGGGKSTISMVEQEWIAEAKAVSNNFHIHIDRLNDEKALGNATRQQQAYFTYSYAQCLESITELCHDGDTTIMDEKQHPWGKGSLKLATKLFIVIDSCTRAASKNLIVNTPREFVLPEVSLVFEVWGKNEETRQNFTVMTIPANKNVKDSQTVLGIVVFDVDLPDDVMEWYRVHSKIVKKEIEQAGGASGAGGLSEAKLEKYSKMFLQELEKVPDGKYKLFLFKKNKQGTGMPNMLDFVMKIDIIAVLDDKEIAAVIRYAFFTPDEELIDEPALPKNTKHETNLFRKDPWWCYFAPQMDEGGYSFDAFSDVECTGLSVYAQVRRHAIRMRAWEAAWNAYLSVVIGELHRIWPRYILPRRTLRALLAKVTKTPEETERVRFLASQGYRVPIDIANMFATGKMSLAKLKFWALRFDEERSVSEAIKIARDTALALDIDFSTSMRETFTDSSAIVEREREKELEAMIRAKLLAMGQEPEESRPENMASPVKQEIVTCSTDEDDDDDDEEFDVIPPPIQDGKWLPDLSLYRAKKAENTKRDVDFYKRFNAGETNVSLAEESSLSTGDITQIIQHKVAYWVGVQFELASTEERRDYWRRNEDPDWICLDPERDIKHDGRRGFPDTTIFLHSRAGDKKCVIFYNEKSYYPRGNPKCIKVDIGRWDDAKHNKLHAEIKAARELHEKESATEILVYCRMNECKGGRIFPDRLIDWNLDDQDGLEFQLRDAKPHGNRKGQI